MMNRFAEEIKLMDVEIDRKQRDQEALDRRNQSLTKDLEVFREKEIQHAHTRAVLEDETQRRIALEQEAHRLKLALSDLQAKSSNEIDNNKRVIEELRFNNQESTSTIH